MSHSYCELKGIMSKCMVHVHRKANPKLQYSMCKFYEPRSLNDPGCVYLRKELDYHCDCLDAQKEAHSTM